MGSLQGDPGLKPERAFQLDASVEWYFKSGGQVHVAAFYKKISDFIGTEAGSAVYSLPATVTNQGALSTNVGTANETDPGSGATITPCANPVIVGESCPQQVPYTYQRWFNENQAATLAGIEAGIQKYFDFLPHPLNGLGIDANYTFIDSHQPGAQAYDMLGNKINGLPVTGISRNTINFTVMYDSGPLSMRLAYNWRDSFLVTTTAYQTSGGYANDSYVPDTSNGGLVNQYARPTYFALPVFQYPTGYLDGNLTYRLSNHVTAVLQASNLMNTTTRLYMGSGNEKANRSWYTADRRYTAAIRFQF
jgi:TonB-dependent receptor